MHSVRTTLLALPLALIACGYTAPSGTANPPPPAAMVNDITIPVGASALTTTAFTPNPKVVSLGGNASVTVRWVNKDISGGDYIGGAATNHSIASDNDAFPPSGVLGGNATYSVDLTTPGTYPYHCPIHPNMVASITVEE